MANLLGTVPDISEIYGHLENATLQGMSAYEVAVKNGYTGTEAEWLASLKGETGETPNIQVGNVSTGQPGTNASATMTGTKENPVLNMTIPRGDVGATPNMTIGTVTTGEEGTQAQATITGTPENPVLNLTIPRGDTGDAGFDPIVEVTKDGNTATVSVTDATHTTEVNIVDGYTPQKNVDYFDGHSPKITGAKSQGTTFIYSDGEQIGAIADGQDGYTPRKGVDYFDGHTPAISGEKIDDTTFIYADGIRIATVLDGLDGNSPVITTVKSGKTTSILADSVVIGTVSDGADGHSPTITTTKSGKTTTILSDGTSIGSVTDGQDGHSPEITTNKVGKILTILSDGQTIGTVSDGADAVSPTITTDKSGTTTTIYSNGSPIGSIEDGPKGDDGDTPEITTSKTGKTTTIYADGSPIGTVDDGTTPSITASKSGSVTTISLNGNPIAEINDGTPGQDGDPGQDGVSPSATVTQTTNGATITITDKTGTTTATVTNGQDGDDGYSPSASVSKSGRVATITVTDKTGTTTAQVSDGQDGASTIIDATPTEDSPNAVSSGGVYDELSYLKNDLNYVGIPDIYSGQTSFSGLPQIDKEVTITSDYFNEKFYTTELNALPTRKSTATLGGVTWTPVANHYELSGAYTSGAFMFNWEKIVPDSNIVKAGDNVTFCIKANITLMIWIRYTNPNGTTGNLVNATAYDPVTNMVKINFSLPSDFVNMRITVYGTNTTYSGSNGLVWFGLYKSPVTFTLCGASFISGSTTLDTLYNTMSFETFKNTKDYVDGSIQAVNEQIEVISDKVDNGITFLTPEMYGAVGDGTVDDAEAFQDCINASVSNRIPIMAEKKYKITETLSVIGDYLDIKINEIVYSGSGTAIEFICNYSTIAINRIIATTSGAAGISFTNRASGSPDRCQSNLINLGTVWTNGNCIEFNFPSPQKYAYYNELHLRRGYSSNGNIFYIDSGVTVALSECDFYGTKYIACPNGYVIYIKDCGCSSGRFHEFAMEGDCKNGVYGVTNLINCRTAEMLDTYTDENPRGYLFKVKNAAATIGLITENTRCDYLSIDMTEAMSWDDVLLAARKKVDDDKSYLDLYYHFGTNYDLCEISFCNRIGSGGHFNDDSNTQRLCVQGKLKISYNNLIFIPNKRCVRSIDTASFTPYTTDYTFPTDFLIDADCTINLNQSYCCVGINDIVVVQRGGHVAIVKDKNNNTIFDGTSKGDGAYRLLCSFEPLGELVVNGLNTEKFVTMPAYYTANIYTGSNERWIEV